MTAELKFTEKFDSYVCEGDRIRVSVDGFDITARIERDDDYKIDDDDYHNTDQSVTGCDDDQYRKLLAARKAWFNDEWFYGGIVLSVSRKGIELADYAASLWGIECNYPTDDDDHTANAYLNEVADELLSEALEAGRAKLSELCVCS